MRVMLCVIAVSWLSANAFAQAPPSPELERAIRLYDKKDFPSASILFHELLQGAASAQDKQRAEFFLGKTLVNMEYPAAAIAWFDRIANAPGHTYRTVVPKWIAAAAELSSHLSADSLMSQLVDVVDDPAIDGATRAAIHFHAGRQLVRSDPPAAIAMLDKVASGTKYFGRARLEMAMARFMTKELPGAIDAALDALDDRDVAVDVVIELDTWTRRLSARDQADDAIAQLARGGSVRAGFAALANVRRGLEQSKSIDYVPAVRAWNATILAAACGRTPLEDVVAPSRTVARETADRMRELLAKFDDNAEMYDAMQKILRGRADSASTLLFVIALDDPTTRETARFVQALRLELERVQRADRAWQTTMVAAEILQELTVQSSVAQADLGKRYRHRMEEIERELRAIASSWQPMKNRLEVRASPTPRGIVITDTMCAAAIGKQTSTEVIAATAPELPVTTPPQRGRGCAGCGVDARSNDWLSSGIAWILVVIVALRRRV